MMYMYYRYHTTMVSTIDSRSSSLVGYLVDLVDVASQAAAGCAAFTAAAFAANPGCAACRVRWILDSSFFLGGCWRAEPELLQ